MTKRRFAYMALFLTTMAAYPAGLAKVEFHNEAVDTARINEILASTTTRSFANPEERTAFIAQQFLGTPYVAHTLEGDEELLRVNTEELDCTTFAETALALSITAAEKRSSWRDFVYNLENLRYRRGEMNGYASRLHYNCDWMAENEFRGNFIDATRSMPEVRYMTRSIDFMTANRDKYPSLADSATFERIKQIESGYRNHRFPYVRTAALNNKDIKAALRTGDVVGLVSNLKNLDVTHMGIIVKRDGEPYLLHASMSGGKVLISDVPLAEFMRRNRHFIGIRIARLKE